MNKTLYREKILELVKAQLSNDKGITDYEVEVMFHNAERVLKELARRYPE